LEDLVEEAFCMVGAVGDDQAIVEEFDFGSVAEGDVFVEEINEYICPNKAILW
jgi:hypothetical protein